MTVQMITSTIQLILAPEVMITACALMLGGILARYDALNTRLRTMARERLDLTRAKKTEPSDALTIERFQEIDMQLPDILRRHKRLRDALLTIYCAVLIFIATMILIAIAAAADSPSLSSFALVVFLVGTAMLFASILLTALEVRQSHHAVEYEAQRVMELK